MPDRRVLDMAAAGRDRSHDNFAGVDADSALERIAAVGDELRRVSAQLFLHADGGVERALRMVLVRDGGAEQRENSIAGALHDVAIVTMHRRRRIASFCAHCYRSS